MPNSFKKFQTTRTDLKDSRAVEFLYRTAAGRIILKLLARVFVSRLIGAVLNSGFSRIFISGFIKRSNIDMEEYCQSDFRSFNDFFTREIKSENRPHSSSSEDLISPCDGKLTAYRISENSSFYIKHQQYSVESLLQDAECSEEYIGGIALIFRLEPSDYHRYCHITDGRILSHKKIKGVLHTVRPVAHERFKVYAENSRECTKMLTTHECSFIQIEVGALFVGKITNHRHTGEFTRGQEKGLFEFGGSTIVLLFTQGTVELNQELYINTEQNMESIVKQGETIGSWQSADGR